MRPEEGAVPANTPRRSAPSIAPLERSIGFADRRLTPLPASLRAATLSRKGRGEKFRHSTQSPQQILIWLPAVGRPQWRRVWEEQMDPVRFRAIAACLPPRLHGFSSVVLDHYLAGRMTTAEFRRWFHMPNSEYLPVSDCIAQLVDPAYVPEARLPAAITLIPPEAI
jgi:hypothetical protein